MTLNFFKSLQAVRDIVVVDRAEFIVKQRNQIALLTFELLSYSV
jgi:hypothetical protein